MRRRDWLVQQGLAKPGRGKFSNDAKAALAKAEAEGVVFDDTAPTKISTKAPTEKPTEKSAGGQSDRESEPSVSLYLFPEDYRYPEATHRAFYRKNGRKIEVGMREVCNTCRVSLVDHVCVSPSIHDSIAVTIEGW